MSTMMIIFRVVPVASLQAEKTNTMLMEMVMLMRLIMLARMIMTLESIIMMIFGNFRL